jgi:hypothetical protein
MPLYIILYMTKKNILEKIIQIFIRIFNFIFKFLKSRGTLIRSFNFFSSIQTYRLKSNFSLDLYYLEIKIKSLKTNCFCINSSRSRNSRRVFALYFLLFVLPKIN